MYITPCGCGATVEQCTCGNSPEVDYVEGDTCPVCNMLALDVSNPGSCGCNSMGEGKVNMNTGHAITTASAEKKSAPKVASNTKKAVNNLATTPGDKITGLEMGNLMASKRNTKDSKQFAKKPDAMKPTDTKINYKGL
jgi:hypothetical protein